MGFFKNPNKGFAALCQTASRTEPRTRREVSIWPTASARATASLGLVVTTSCLHSSAAPLLAEAIFFPLPWAAPCLASASGALTWALEGALAPLDPWGPFAGGGSSAGPSFLALGAPAFLALLADFSWEALLFGGPRFLAGFAAFLPEALPSGLAGAGPCKRKGTVAQWLPSVCGWSEGSCSQSCGWA